METLANTGIVTPYRIAVDSNHVYWADTGNDTIKLAQTYGSHTVPTIADSSDGVSNVTGIDVDGSYLYWADSGNDSVRRVFTFSPYTVTTLVDADLAQPWDLEVGRNGSYVYVMDRNATSSTIKRVQTLGSTPSPPWPATPPPLPWTTPSPWRWIRTTATCTGWTRTIGRCDAWRPTGPRGPSRLSPRRVLGLQRVAAQRQHTDLAVSPDGGSVYWLDDFGNRIKRMASDGGGPVSDVITSGLNAPTR